MISRILFFILIFLSAVVESTILPFPFVFLFCSIMFIFFEGLYSFIIILLGALMLDILSLNHIGYTPLILFSFFLFILILENVFTYRNSIILGIFLIIGVFLYKYFTGYPFSLILSMILIIAVLGYVIFEHRIVKKKGATGPEGPLARREGLNAA